MRGAIGAGVAWLWNHVTSSNPSPVITSPQPASIKPQTVVQAEGTFGGKQDTKSETGRKALRKAKEQNGIPRSQQPDKTSTVREKNTGKPLKQYEYTNNKGEKIQVRKDNPKKYGDGGKGDQREHYNAGSANEKLYQHHDYKK